MDKNIGFRRNISLAWLDATAALCIKGQDPARIRAELDPLVGEKVASAANRRMALDTLLNIWVKTGETNPEFQEEAVELFAQAQTAADRLYLHYGLTLLRYDFFRLAAVIIGQLSRHSDTVTTAELKKKLFAELGQLGSVDNAAERIIYSLRDWGILLDSGRHLNYKPLLLALTTSPEGQQWLLAVALAAHPALEMPFSDLVRLPELFPFRFTVSVDDLRQSPRFEVQRQGLGWDMVRLIPGVRVSIQGRDAEATKI